MGDTEFDVEMASRVREKLKRTAEDKQTEDAASKDSIEDVFSFNRSKKRKLVCNAEFFYRWPPQLHAHYTYIYTIFKCLAKDTKGYNLVSVIKL